MFEVSASEVLASPVSAFVVPVELASEFEVFSGVGTTSSPSPVVGAVLSSAAPSGSAARPLSSFVEPFVFLEASFSGPLSSLSCFG